MKLLEKVVAAVMAMAMLTACSGGGGGAGGGTPVAPSTFSSTKTYQLVQSGQGKPLYMEFWQAYTDDKGALILDKDDIMKEGVSHSGTYADFYVENTLTVTLITANGKDYAVLYSGTSTYDEYAEAAIRGGAEIPKGKNIYVDTKLVNQAWFGNPNESPVDPGKLDASDMTVEIGTYTMPGTSEKYYAEIFTYKTDPGHKITYAYDNNDELKAVEEVFNNNRIDVMVFNKFKFDSPEFKISKLNVANYGAIDITSAYLAGLGK